MSAHIITIDSEFAGQGHPDPWRNQIALELNAVLTRCRYLEATTNDAADRAFINAALSLVRRVAEFEEIQLNPTP